MGSDKARYWTAVLYPENMLENWRDEIGDILQVPYAYCIHDKCLEKDCKTPRKTHVHILLAFNNTTTYNHVVGVLQGLEKEGQKAFNKIQRVISVRHVYDYLIHDTEDCRKKKKYVYEPSERILGNNFDIGIYECLSSKEKSDIAQKLCDIIIELGFINFADFYSYVMENGTPDDFEVIKTYSGLFERLTKGNYQRKYVQYAFTDSIELMSRGKAKPIRRRATLGHD